MVDDLVLVVNGTWLWFYYTRSHVMIFMSDGLGRHLWKLSYWHLTLQNLGGHVTLAMPNFRKIFKGSCPHCACENVSGLKSVALTVLNWSDWPVCCAHTDRLTSNKNSISAIHFVHLAEIINVQWPCPFPEKYCIQWSVSLSDPDSPIGGPTLLSLPLTFHFPPLSLLPLRSRPH